MRLALYPTELLSDGGQGGIRTRVAGVAIRYLAAWLPVQEGMSRTRTGDTRLVYPSACESGRASSRGGRGGIRTPGAVTPFGFQDRRLKPLGHPSKAGGRERIRTSGAVTPTCFRDKRLKPLGHSSKSFGGR